MCAHPMVHMQESGSNPVVRIDDKCPYLLRHLTNFLNIWSHFSELLTYLKASGLSYILTVFLLIWFYNELAILGNIDLLNCIDYRSSKCWLIRYLKIKFNIIIKHTTETFSYWAAVKLTITGTTFPNFNSHLKAQILLLATSLVTCFP